MRKKITRLVLVLSEAVLVIVIVFFEAYFLTLHNSASKHHGAR